MADDVTVRVWTSTEVRALRLARRMPLRDFAEHLGVSDRIVSKWEAGTAHPGLDNQAALDTSLRLADHGARERFVLDVAERRKQEATPRRDEGGFGA